jgi:hypothetical protein
MKNNLEKEAEKYRLSTGNQMYIEKQAFIAGANSKYAQIEKLKFAIEQVLKFRKTTFGLGNSGLEKLQQQLKELEDE